MSDSRAAFAHALRAHGFVLARGDRRGAVAVDYRGEAYSVSRYVGIKAKQVRDRLGDLSAQPDAATAQNEAAQNVQNRLDELRREEARRKADEDARRIEEQNRLRTRQAWDAAQLRQTQRQREREAQASRLRDEQERQATAARQAQQLAAAQSRAKAEQQKRAAVIKELSEDIDALEASKEAERHRAKEAYKRERKSRAPRPKRSRRPRNGPSPER